MHVHVLHTSHAILRDMQVKLSEAYKKQNTEKQASSTTSSTRTDSSLRQLLLDYLPMRELLLQLLPGVSLATSTTRHAIDCFDYLS